MAIDNKFEVCEVDDPERCQAVHAKGQCRYKSVADSKYCAMHGGNKGQAVIAGAMKRQYQLAKWQADVDAFGDEDNIKSLRGEIGLMRMLLQETVIKCKDSNELLLHMPRISDTIIKIDKLVNSCHRLETNMGMLLDKTKVMTLATVIVEIISKHVTDSDAIAAISQQICVAILNTSGTETAGAST